jgi:SSS family solute:Na+ symporter
VTAAEAAALQEAGQSLPIGIAVLENSLQAFPTFILGHLPAWLGGIALGTLLINILGCGSGLVLGAATILTRAVYGNLATLLRRTPRLGQLAQTRLSIVLLLALGVVAAHFVRGSFINDLGFLSLGLRAAALLLPLSFALWLPGRFHPHAVTASMITGTLAMLVAGFAGLPADPMYYGLAASALVLLPRRKRK